MVNRNRVIVTSLFSSGVPGIGTNAFTGKDSGCSGILRTKEMSER